jgi:hypothetical protein
MFKTIRKLLYVLTVFLMAVPLVSCSGGGSDAVGSSGLSDGRTIWLTDGPSIDLSTGDYEVWVTINAVQVKPDDTAGWETILDFADPLELDLLKLTNGARVALGTVDPVELAPGHYSQMRLMLSDSEDDNWVVTPDGTFLLKVPSGGESGVKLVNGFTIANDSTDIILDFDVHKSIFMHGAKKLQKWILRPTIKVVEIENTVSGTVYEEDSEGGIVASGRARVSAWTSDTEEELVNTLTKSEDDLNTDELETGTYFMYLPLNMTEDFPYNMVATKDGFMPECQSLGSAVSGEYTEVDFTLTPVTESYALDIEITGLPVPPEPEPGGEPETFLGAFSIMQEIDCSGDSVPDTMIEVGLYNFVNADGTDKVYDPITLPVGDYEIFAWTEDAEGEINLGPISITIVDSNVAQTIDFSL